jgi:putative inorganic carbon (hco3(-)) transporter
LNAPESISGALPAAARPWFLPARGLAWWSFAVATAVLTAWLTLQSLQLGCTLTMVILTVGLYVRNRTAGLSALWLIWLLTPFLRRLFLLGEPIQRADPLALAPFLVTAAVIVLELSQVELSRRTRRMLLFVVGGYALGLPVGLLYGPSAAIFAFFAYVTALGCFVIGYREADQKRLILPTVLMIVTPVLALYAFRQYYLPLPQWDRIWQRTADINSVGSPDTGRVRVWSTLNSPGTFSLVLGTAALALVTWRRLTPLKVVAALAVFGALALTYVRSAWVAVVFALLAVVVVTHGTAMKRVVPMVLVLAALAPVALGGSTGAALTERFNTFGGLGTDTSAQARTSTPSALVPVALRTPIGTGLGSAGEPSRLKSAATLRYTDNGLLSLMAQVGPVGFLVVMSVVLMAIVTAWRNAWRRASATDVLAFGVLAFLAVTLFAGDQLYGIGGMIFWYMAGLAMRRRELWRQVPT